MTRILIASIVSAAVLSGPMASAAPVKEVPPAVSGAAAGTQTAILTGRWRFFFGGYICLGQQFNIPGESQCV